MNQCDPKSEPRNVLDHPLVVQERTRLTRTIVRLEAWLIVSSGAALLFLLMLFLSR